ncbi:MAG: magnesium chelatase subunit D [Polaromonas sp.]|nr:magnesium chelatase subunit D [Polaromonas sp.]
MSADAATVAALLAVDSSGLGGVALRSSASIAREEWLGLLKQLLPANTPFRRVPLNINDTALLGGLDLGATLHAGRPVVQQGVLAQSDGGVVLLAMAERLSLGTAARLAAVLDTHEVAIERDGLAVRRPARLGMVALDEGAGDDEKLPAALLDRLAFHVVLDERVDSREPQDHQDQITWQPGDVINARVLLPRVAASDETLQALCAAALALGVDSLRAPLLALRVARAAAALSGQTEVCEEHVALAARLVLAPRATRLLAPPPEETDEAEEDNSQAEDKQDEQTAAKPEAPPPDTNTSDSSDPADDAPSDQDQSDTEAGSSLAETVLKAAQAAIPAGLLAALKLGDAARSRAQAAGRSGAAQKSQMRGRPLGARRGEPRAGARLNVIETLRAAAPWQKLRQREAAMRAPQAGLVKPGLAPSGQRIYVRREDFHITRFKQVGQTTTLFVVDASGSSALNRLAEAKGAVELLLADCYVRRDRVSVLAFRGKTAELLLPPTRSLARAKRSLAGLPGGGGTPLATAIDAARELADQISRRGETPIIVLLTDGRGNIARDGAPGRAKASEDALAAACQLRIAGITCLLMDTSPQPQPTAQLLAREMGAAYVPLPYAGAQMLSQVVRAATAIASTLR